MIVLPDWVSPQIARPRLISKGIWHKSLGGSHSRTDRPGSRYGVNITLPPMRQDYKSDALLSDLRAGLRQGIEIRWPHWPDSRLSLGDAVQVNGTDVQGTSLPLDGLMPNAVIRKGAFFSIEHDGGVFLHENRVETIVAANGQATLTIEPELRVILSDNDPVEMDRPVFRGVIDVPEWEWDMRLDRFYHGLAFDLVEKG